jgi:cytidylate kinase
MVIAIFGRSSVGKTTVATILGTRSGLSVRHCGEIVKQYAKSRNSGVHELTKEAHATIDDATRRVAASTESSIIEGTFLDIVLASIPGVIFIRLSCSETARQQRFANRNSGGPKAYMARDEEDDALRTHLFGKSGNSPTCVELETSRLTAEEVADRIMEVCNLLPH